MMHRSIPRYLIIAVTLILSPHFSGLIGTAYGADGATKKRQDLLRKIRELEQKKREEQQRFIKKQEKTKPTGKSLEEVIARYEKLLKGCIGKKSSRCADVISTLASLYYDQARDNYIRAREEYERKMNEWERRQSGPEPVNPLPDYSNSLDMYKRLIKEYPDFGRVDEAYYQIGTINLVMGALDVSKRAFERLIEEKPNSRRASAAHFRLADFAYMEHDYSRALKHLKQVKESDVTLEIVEMTQYRKAEIYYNMAEFDKAIDLFFRYRENCDAGSYRKCEFREEALEFMAIAFSDMDNGAREAIKFFKRVGGRPYEKDVLYTIGFKNRKHGQYDDAILALSTALERFPYYKDAPLAQQQLVECYLIKKEYEKANAAREKLVDFYQPGSEWYSKNSGERAVIEQAKGEVKHALAAMPIYYHARAQKTKDRSLYQKALDRYHEFFEKFPEDKWRVYEFKYNAAEIYNELQEYQKAAEYYDYVSSQDLSTYPEYKAEIDTLGLDQEEIEKLKKEAQQGPRAISQQDAGYNAIVALDNARKKMMAREGLNDEQAFSRPETKQFLEYLHRFQKRFPQNENAADVLYLGANVYYSAKQYQNAISEFQFIINNYPSSKITSKALRGLAKSYVMAKEYDLALSKYRELLSKQSPGSAEYNEIVDLAAGAMFKKAEEMKKSGNLMGAADAFKAIESSFPKSKVADRGWFEAGVCLEEASSPELAAGIFEQLAEKFPKSKLREKAFLRAADNFKKVKKWAAAAAVYIKAANTISTPEYAIGSLAAASECYQKLEQFDKAGKMYELIYQRYSDDPKTPQALYNAGLIFEKGGFYENAVKVYSILAEKFPKSEYSAEAVFSIGLCYEKMGKNERMAEVFSDYAKKYPSDRYKQVEALVKAGDAYFNMKKHDLAEKNYRLATVVHEEYKKTADMDVNSVARAWYKLGEIKYGEFMDHKLTGRNERQVKDAMKKKTKLLEASARPYGKAIEMGVQKWTLRATYMIGQGFVDLAEAVKEQPLFGNTSEKIAAKIKILSTLEKYYILAQDKFLKNIEWAYEQGIRGEFVDKSKERFMEMAYLKGDILEEVGRTFKNAPIPAGLDKEERIAYKEVLEEKLLEAMDAALPKYEEAVRAAAELGIPDSKWLDKAKQRVVAINPTSEALNIAIAERKPKVVASASGEVPGEPGRAPGPRKDEEFKRNMQRIRNIMDMGISVEDKIKQLNRIEMEAQRNIILEEERIRELKEKQAGE